MSNKNFIMSFSGGKDSVLALYRMINKGYNPIGLLTTINKSKGESWTHSIKKDILKKVSKSLNIPLLMVECDVSEYEDRFEDMLKYSKSLGASICVYGDIDIEHHKQWGVDRCKNVGLKFEFPLWKEDRESLVNEFIDNKFTTIIKTVNLKYLDSDFLGKKLTKELIKDIKETGSDVCGENGEYHTIVVDGPIFNEKINFNIKAKKEKNGYGHLDIELVES